MADVLYFEDLTPGRQFRSGSRLLDAEQIKAFARDYDPQPFHTDEIAAAATFFRGLAASGWHTTAIMMRLIVDGEFRPAGGVIGAGVDELRWPRPVRPGDTLSVVSEVVESRVSKSRPEQGIVRVRHTTVNQNGEAVLEIIGNHVVPRRPA
ncbi:MAG: MaoC family dehydratase [Alphaproteobacteria bacterium]|nr:MaoC family dehydratase [Alphaproteobacteria bacterium]